MANRKGPDDEELKQLYAKHKGNITGIARELKKSRNTVDHWYKNQLGLPGKGVSGQNAAEHNAPEEDVLEFPEFPEDDLTAPEILKHLGERFELRYEHKQSKTWFPVKVNIDGPIGLSFFGDPHLDSNGCNIPLVTHHAALHRKNDALFGVNIGDSLNNWTGRLAKLYANQDTSKSTAFKLAEWFLRDAGIKWACWLMGNHDMWGDLAAVMRAMNVENIPMEDWQARFKLVFPNGRECKIWAAHDFKGHSMWNTLHGPQKAAHMKNEAHIYACGHTHNWAMHQEESGSRDFTYWLIRSRGYKHIDSYGELLGHFPQQEGSTITAIIDPDADTLAGFIQCFADMDAAVDYLQWKRQSIQ